MKEHCDEKGNLIENNLTVDQINAIKGLKTKMKNENLVCVETDKTGKFALDTKENYINKINKHISNDEVIAAKDVTTIENKLNKHAEHASKITKAGENTGQTSRIKSNFITKDNQVPVLHGTSKDHKISEDVIDGPDVRPIMGAVVGPNVALANFIGSEIVRRVAEDAGNENVCKSTEELLGVFEAFNKNRVKNGYHKKNLVIGSMDIKKWYPRTLIRPTAKVIRQMIIISEIKFEGIEYDALSKHLGEATTIEEIVEEQFEEIVYIKNENANKNNKEEKYHKPIREPTDTEKRNMLSKSIEIMIIATLENHIYRFGNEIRKQKEGGPIGLSLTGEIADCYMVNWDKLFLKKLKSLGIQPAVYERFKDDISIVVESLEAGSRFENNSIVIDQQKKVNDMNKSDEEITMEVLRNIAGSVDDMTEFTVDFPQNYKTKKIPMLDVQASIGKENENRIEFEFYEKPTNNKKVILSDTAIPAKQQRTILTQECLRRLRNTQRDLGKNVQVKHVNNFMVKMKNSGYSVLYRKQIVDSTYKAWDKILQADESGEKPLYRDKNWKKQERREFKQKNRLNWYKNDENCKNKVQYCTVLFVPVTKGGLLIKELKKREYEINRFSQTRIKFVEDGGIQLKSFLVQKDPFPTLKCEKQQCFVCRSEKSENLKYACNSKNAGYRLECDTCYKNGKIRVYEGESSRSVRIRGAEHWADYRKMRPNSVLWKHKENDHKDEDMVVKMKITKIFKDPLYRQANSKGELLNSKSEFNHPHLSRIVVEKK